MVDIIFFNIHIVEIWLIFFIGFIALFLLLFKNYFYNRELASDKINYYIIIFFIAFLLSVRYLNDFAVHLENENYNIIFSSYSNEKCQVFLSWSKSILLALCILFWILLKVYIKSEEKLISAEILILFSSVMLGLYLILCSSDFIWLYLSLELYGLSMYCIVYFFNPSNLNSSIKYFIVGSVSSLLLLFSITVIYYFTGSFSFDSISLHVYMFNFDFNENIYIYKNIFIFFGVCLFILSFLIKLGLAPFYLWAMDAYSTQPYFIVFFLLIVVKSTFFNFMVNLFVIKMPNLLIFWPIFAIFIFTAILSLIVGTVGIIYETNIKKIFIYSSLSNTIFLLMPFFIPSCGIVSNYMAFFIFYFFNLVGILAIMLIFTNWSILIPFKKIDSLKNFYTYYPVVAVLFSIFLLSLSGFPPFPGFFIKYYFLQSLYYYSIPLFVLTAIANFISFIYSLWIITTMFFSSDKSPIPLLIVPSKFLINIIIYLIILLNFFLIFYLPLFYSIHFIFIFFNIF